MRDLSRRLAEAFNVPAWQFYGMLFLSILALAPLLIFDKILRAFGR